jgi:hypothetical protein
MLPLITPSDRRAISKLPLSIEEHVDIADLTWGDRERVLRLLFAKINNSEPMQHMPPHLLDMQDDANFGSAMAPDYFDVGPALPEGDETFLTTDGLEAGEMRGQSSHGVAAPLA